MTSIDPTRLLEQLQSLSSQAARSPSALGLANQAVAPTGAASFASILGSAISQVNTQQVSASDLATAFDNGTPGVDLTQVMIESQKAALSFKAMSEVRNKLVSAYQDIMNMPL